MKGVDVFRKTLIDIITEKKGEFDIDSWEADYKLDWDDELSELMDKARSDISRAARALENKDSIELCVAVLRARVRFMDLSNFFRDIFDDFDVLARDVPWPEIPDDYVYDEK